ncbi:ER membrane protein complex subunit 7 homolog [Eurytemora carolleeae]|uniref:ER membrane protein complex subunit 7 homolog n=1 Tax=Eurytemora carolleeae TaxID=1294199 RepID=UPI000C769B97|nr:ER membrane protein complex subunit 7 homolog [Eurytemora carolleeae]|eukprot:XP_023339482.1 ER membrane protein complex subunit 7 homolog [Eurytemora affinis]
MLLKQLQLVVLSGLLAVVLTEEESGEGEGNYKIEGKLTPPDVKSLNWVSDVSIILDGGKRRTFLNEDNSFSIQGVGSGSYLLEVEHPDYMYEPVRVDINSKGKHRARKNNQVQPSQVTQLPYPLRMKPLGRFRYFQQREEWKVTDILFNPMVMMMVLPLLLVTVLPKMMQDPDTKKEMEEMQAKMSVQNQMPEVSELFTNFFGGGAQPKKKPAIRRR